MATLFDVRSLLLADGVGAVLPTNEMSG